MFKLSNICLKYVRHMLKSFVKLRTEYVKLIVLNFFQWLCKTQYSLFKVIVTCFLISFILMNSDFFVCLFFFSLFLMKSCFKFPPLPGLLSTFTSDKSFKYPAKADMVTRKKLAEEKFFQYGASL